MSSALIIVQPESNRSFQCETIVSQDGVPQLQVGEQPHELVCYIHHNPENSATDI